MSKALENLDLNASGLWFAILISFLLLLIAAFIPKKYISWREIYFTFGIVGLATWICDALIARVFDLIDLGDEKMAGLGEILSYTFIPTSLAVIYINYYTKKNRWILSIIFTFISILIDLGMQYFGYMQYNGWNLFFSILFIFIAYAFLIPLHIRIIRDK
ncbi:hypothetical protein [Virgibacillus sp. 6R]|uniref:hypothetical protein n=1 Tax=Metabacillus sp. 22489 TaxID=3453928 RepID=UPI0011A1FC5F